MSLNMMVSFIFVRFDARKKWMIEQRKEGENGYFTCVYPPPLVRIETVGEPTQNLRRHSMDNKKNIFSFIFLSPPFAYLSSEIDLMI